MMIHRTPVPPVVLSEEAHEAMFAYSIQMGVLWNKLEMQVNVRGRHDIKKLWVLAKLELSES